jgi:hypothetical protein
MQRVVVVGGGLAGLVAAREIARSGREVTLLERSQRLGGKAGANRHGERLVEHGYHVFPTWYPNVRRLLRELGVTLIDFDRYHYVLPGEYPEKVTVRGPSSLGAVVHNLTHGLLPWYQTVLFYAFTLDLVAKDISDKHLLDRVSEIGLMRQAWYVTEAVAEMNQENLLKASAIPAYEMSAMTAKRIGGYWMQQASPFLSVLPGDLQSTFIEPLAKTVRDAGVQVRLGVEVTGFDVADGRIASVRVGDERITADAFVLAVPFEVARGWIAEPLFTLDPSLGNMHLLEAQPMSALHVRTKKRIPGLPREHVFFHGGAFGLSFIDVAPLWSGWEGSELSFIASNFAPLRGLSEEGATRALLAEISDYLPLRDSDIVDTVLNTNVSTPLFINTIGAWPNRPTARTFAKNLYVAGDYAKNPIDLACMEGAVHASLQAARALLRDAGVTTKLPEPEVPPVPSRALLLALRAGLFPAVVAAYGTSRIVEALFPKAPRRSSAHARQHRKAGSR